MNSNPTGQTQLSVVLDQIIADAESGEKPINVLALIKALRELWDEFYRVSQDAGMGHGTRIRQTEDQITAILANSSTAPSVPAVTDEKALEKKEAVTRNTAVLQKFNRVVALVKNLRLPHGTCEPRLRQACTHCNSREELDAIADSWPGAKLILSEHDGQPESASGVSSPESSGVTAEGEEWTTIEATK